MAAMGKTSFLRTFGAVLGLSVLLVTAGSATTSHAAPRPRAAVASSRYAAAAALDEAAIGDVLSEARIKYRIPGMAAAILQDGQLVVAADGLRQAKTAGLVTTDDRWSLGSCGKAMTATLCARLVEKGVLTWNTEISEVFPELQGVMRFEYANITLRELLAHRGGFPEYPSKKLERQISKATGTPAEIREQFLPDLLRLKSVGRPGVSFTYSNVGYSVAAAMLERLTGFTYEELMEIEVFEPLGLTTAGFGEPRTAENAAQPVGHTSKGKPVLPGSPLLPPAAGNPAGLIHMSMQDWARFAAIHLDEAGTKGYLSSATLNFLHQAFPGTAPQYALGWLRLNNGTDNILAHTGSNGYWYTLIALLPGRHLALMVACNQGGKKADKATLDVVNTLAGLLEVELPPAPTVRGGR